MVKTVQRAVTDGLGRADNTRSTGGDHGGRPARALYFQKTGSCHSLATATRESKGHRLGCWVRSRCRACRPRSHCGADTRPQRGTTASRSMRAPAKPDERVAMTGKRGNRVRPTRKTSNPAESPRFRPQHRRRSTTRLQHVGEDLARHSRADMPRSREIDRSE